MAHSAVAVNQAPSQPRASETRAPTPPVAAPGPAPASIAQPGGRHSHQPTGPLLPFALPVFSCAMRAGLPSPQLLSRRASPRYRRLDLGVLSISLVHFGTVYSVSRSPYIAMAGLGKASRLSPRLRELLAHLADHATELVDDLPIDRAVFREPMGQGGGASWRHALHGARLLTYSPFFSCVLRRRWGTSYSVDG